MSVKVPMDCQCGKECLPILVTSDPTKSEYYCPKCHKSYKMPDNERAYLFNMMPTRGKK